MASVNLEMVLNLFALATMISFPKTTLSMWFFWEAPGPSSSRGTGHYGRSRNTLVDRGAVEVVLCLFDQGGADQVGSALAVHPDNSAAVFRRVD